MALPLLLMLPAPAARVTTRTPAKAKLVAGAPYPAEAKKRKVEGNVVLSGEITSEGKVTGLKVLASSSPLLDQAALRYVSTWGFGAAKEDGKPVAIRLNTVVRFRKDRGKANETDSLPAPIVGNLALYPLPGKGEANPADEGFPIERDDRGVEGVLDLDIPASFSPKNYTVDVTDVGPRGKITLLMQKGVSAGRKGISTRTLSFSRSFHAGDSAEKGLHTIRVTVDGLNAGGAQYQVGSQKN
ncbi:MAG: energy transducer TonB [Thermoanaerobaculia bacterium]